MSDEENRHYNSELDRLSGHAPAGNFIAPWYLGLTLIPGIALSIWLGVVTSPVIGLLVFLFLVFAVILPFYPG